VLRTPPWRPATNSHDAYDLRRFVEAQDPVFERVRAELRGGRKQSHWMWFVFPQIQGLGRSPMAERFAISGLAEAKAYLAHQILGPRLRECTELVNSVERRSASEIFGFPDDLKFHSSMTLFAAAASDEVVFETALQKHFYGQRDTATIERL
jgi:uncharacterized protein (DUF1810 family)